MVIPIHVTEFGTQIKGCAGARVCEWANKLGQVLDFQYVSTALTCWSSCFNSSMTVPALATALLCLPPALSPDVSLPPCCDPPLDVLIEEEAVVGRVRGRARVGMCGRVG